MITKHCKKLKYRRRIVLVTNGNGSMDASDMDEITKKLKDDDIQLIVLYDCVLYYLDVSLIVEGVLISTIRNTASKKKTRIQSR